MTSNGEDDRDDFGSSAPWERAERMNRESAAGHAPAAGDATPGEQPDVESSTAAAPADADPSTVAAPADTESGTPGVESETRPSRRSRRRYADDGEGVAASALIAALSGATQEPTPHASGQTPDSAWAAEPPDSAWAAEPPHSSEPEPTIGAVAESSDHEQYFDADPADSEQYFDAEPAHHEPVARSWWVAGRVAVAVVAVIALLVSGTGWVIKMRADATLADRQISALDPDDTNISPTSDPVPTTFATGVTETTAPAEPQSYEAENFLILGSDDRSKAADAALGGANTDPGGSDVVMVGHLTADRSHITVVSIPRDTYINAPTCKAWDYSTDTLSDKDYTSPYSIWRINSTYAAGGAPCTVKAVQELTGLRITRVIVIDFAGFAAMVDALDGIDVNACHPIVDGQLGTILPAAGVQHIDGKQALDLVRARKVEGDTSSDLARIHRQQKVLSTILKQMTTAGVLLNPLKLDTVLQSFVSNVQTDNVTIDSLVDIVQSLGDLDPRRVTFFTLPTTPDANGVGLHATDAAPLIWEALRNDEPLPGEVTGPVTPTAPPTTPMTTIPQAPVTSTVTSVITTTPTAPQVLSVAPRDVDLKIVNVAGRALVATTVRDSLAELGYRFASSDLLRLDEQQQTGLTIEYSAAGRAAAATVAATVPRAAIREVDGLGDSVRLLVGTSYDADTFAGQLRSVSVGDPVPSALSTTPSPVETTVTSTIVTTPPPLVEPVTPTTTSPSTSTLASSDLTSVNAGSAGCI